MQFDQSSYINVAGTNCQQTHPLTGENTVIHREGVSRHSFFSKSKQVLRLGVKSFITVHICDIAGIDAT